MARDRTLSRSDRERATRLAADHPAVRKLSEHATPVAVERLVRHRNPSQAPNHAVVAIYDYETNQSMVVAVDLDRSRALRATETPARFQLSPEETKGAERLAGQDPRVRGFLRGRSMDPLTRLYFPPPRRALDRGHRHAIVFLRPSKSDRRYAVVDLSSGTVAEVLGPEHLTKG